MTYVNAYRRPAAPVSRPKRGTAPPSVHAVAILFYLSGAFDIISAAIAAVLGSAGAFPIENVLRPAELARFSHRSHAVYALAAAVALVGLIVIILGRRLQRGRRLSRYLVLFFCAAAIALTLYAAFRTGAWAGAAGVVVPALYLFLLNTRAARSWFRYKDW